MMHSEINYHLVSGSGELIDGVLHHFDLVDHNLTFKLVLPLLLQGRLPVEQPLGSDQVDLAVERKGVEERHYLNAYLFLLHLPHYRKVLVYPLLMRLLVLLRDTKR